MPQFWPFWWHLQNPRFHENRGCPIWRHSTWIFIKIDQFWDFTKIVKITEIWKNISVSWILRIIYLPSPENSNIFHNHSKIRVLILSPLQKWLKLTKYEILGTSIADFSQIWTLNFAENSENGENGENTEFRSFWSILSFLTFWNFDAYTRTSEKWLMV